MKHKITTIIISIFFLIRGNVSATINQKVLIANPSKEIQKTIPVKIYLPKEAKPENIINSGGFEITYDAQAGQYLATQNVTLGPGESVTKIIEIDDVWKMKKKEVAEMKESLIKTVERLKDSPSYKDAKDIQAEVQKQIIELEELQNKVFNTPEEQIAAYRDAQRRLEETRQELAKISTMIMKDSAPDVVNMGHISVKTTWQIIIGIVIMLSVLSIVFFAIWSNQLSSMPKENNENSVNPPGESQPPVK